MSSVAGKSSDPKNIYYPSTRRKAFGAPSSRARSEYGTARSTPSNYTGVHVIIMSEHNAPFVASMPNNKPVRLTEIVISFAKGSVAFIEAAVEKRPGHSISDFKINPPETSTSRFKNIQVELEQLYRVVHFYEGKVQQMQAQLQKFREMVLRSPDTGLTAEQLRVLFEELIKENEELAAKGEQAEYMRISAQQQYQRLREKFMESQRELSEMKRVAMSPLNQLKWHEKAKYQDEIEDYFARNNVPMDSKQKDIMNQKLMEQIQILQKDKQELILTVQQLTKQRNDIKIQRDLLAKQIQEKNEHITQIFKEMMGVKRSLKKIQSQREFENGITPHFKGVGRYQSLKDV